jgi:hypothetical protein
VLRYRYAGMDVNAVRISGKCEACAALHPNLTGVALQGRRDGLQSAPVFAKLARTHGCAG